MSTLLTIGGTYSNHIRATAAAGHYFGFKLIVSPHSLVQRHVEGSAVDVLDDVLTWEPGP